MPGIFGVVDLSPAPSGSRQRELEGIARQMCASMLYEPFYSSTTIFCPAIGAYVGRVGLSGGRGARVERVAESGVVAITTGDGGFQDDAAIARADHGLGAAPRGIHSGFIADHAARRCVLFNDRYGKERLFLHVADTQLIFSSEAKAILAVAPETRAFDATGLAELLACGCTLGERSLFRGIEVLQSGTALTFEGPHIRRRRYFDQQSLEALRPASDLEFLDGFQRTLRSAVNRHIESGANAAVSLTGGLDSRMVMAVLDAPEGSVPSYTFGSMYRTTGDVAVAREVARCCGQSHQVIELGKGFLGRFEETFDAAIYISDGYLGLSGAAELYVNRLARSIAPGRITGNWGGELTRGVRAFKCVTPKGNFLAPQLATHMRECAEALGRTSPNPVSAALFQQMPLQGYGRNAIERSQLEMKHPFLADEVVNWLYRSPAALRQSDAAAVAVIGQRPDLLNIPTDRGGVGTHASRARRVSRAMLIKAEYLTSHGAPDWVARLSARVPAALVERRFLGVDKFQHFRFWMRRDLAGFVRDTLVRTNNGELDAWFDMRRVRHMVDDHIAGRGNYTNELDKLLSLAVAHRLLSTGFARKAA